MRAALALASLWAALAPAQAAEYRIDAGKSQADFGVRLLWLTLIRGHFEHIEGEINLNPRQDLVQVDARIEVTSIQMESKRLRRWVLAPEFFDAEQYPLIYFRSLPVPLRLLDHGGELAGTLTLRGISRAAQFEVQASNCPRQLPQPCEIAVHGNLRRSDYGMNGRRLALSDRVELDLRIVLR